MVQRVDYYALLSRAVESLEPDAYAARGAVYDREHKALLKRLISSAAPCTDADIAREERAFRNAIRQIEFPTHEDEEQEPEDDEEQDEDEEAPPPRSARRGAADAAWPRSSRDRVRAQRREQIREEPPEPPAPPPQDLDRPEARAARRRFAPAYQQTGGEARSLPPQLPAQDARGWDEKAPRPRSLLRATATYLLIMVFVLGAGGVGYFYLVGAINVSWLNEWSELTQWTGLAATSSARAVLYEGSQSGGSSTPAEGKATWGTRIESNSPDGKPDTVVTLDVEIPDPHLAMSLVISRNQEAGAGMSHLIELRFAKPGELFGGIAKIANIAVKASEAEPGDALAGTSVNIAPGQFMFGLLGLPDMVQQNVQRLRSPGWLAINIVFVNGAAYTLAVEKGTAGERAINDALAKWGEAGS